MPEFKVAETLAVSDENDFAHFTLCEFPEVGVTRDLRVLLVSPWPLVDPDSYCLSYRGVFWGELLSTGLS